SFKDFLDTKPPIFKEAIEPLEAEEWLHTLEQKFRLLRLTEELKAEYAAHQLQGPAGIWWGHHRTTYPANVPITWRVFTAAVRGHFIPPGLTQMKVAEFMNLTQGTRSITEYHHLFNSLAR
ncbi:retrotransposon gag family protein, partial [Aeromonas jandaei]|uniref:retrotransposon gag family protein n=1 Tax=Aeromonas jandaei TaxID=650 RepID=UPI0012EB34C4